MIQFVICPGHISFAHEKKLHFAVLDEIYLNINQLVRSVVVFKACVSFNISFLNWKIIIFQCCSGFFCTKAWISLQYTYASYCAVNHLLLLFHCYMPF